MPKQPRLYTYPDEETREKIKASAKEAKLSVSTWIKLACLEKLRSIDQYRKGEKE